MQTVREERGKLNTPFAGLHRMVAEASLDEQQLSREFRDIFAADYAAIPDHEWYSIDVPEVRGVQLIPTEEYLDIVVQPWNPDTTNLPGGLFVIRLLRDGTPDPEAGTPPGIPRLQILSGVLKMLQRLGLDSMIHIPQPGEPLPVGQWPREEEGDGEGGGDPDENRVRLSVLQYYQKWRLMTLEPDKSRTSNGMDRYYTYVFPRGVVFEDPVEDNAIYFFKFPEALTPQEQAVARRGSVQERLDLLERHGLLNRTPDGGYEVLRGATKYQMRQQGNVFRWKRPGAKNPEKLKGDPAHASKLPHHARAEESYYDQLQDFIDRELS